MNPKELEKLTRSALRATLLFFFFHPTEHELDNYIELIMPDLMPKMLQMATSDDLDFEMRKVIYEMVDQFYDHYQACVIREK